MAKLLHPVITAALIVLIVMLYVQVQDLTERLSAVQAAERAVAPSPRRLLVEPSPFEDLDSRPAPIRPVVLNWHRSAAGEVMRRDDDVLKGMKADELEMRQRRIDFIDRLQNPFRPEDGAPDNSL